MLNSRRFGPFRQEWYSICSSHRYAQDDCPRCKKGMWINVYAQKISTLLYQKYPKLWKIWVNRRNSRFNKWLKSDEGRKAFPNMKAR